MRPVVMLSIRLAGAAGEPLVVAEVEVGLGAVVGDEHLAVLVRAHRARIDVEIGVELAQPHAVAARLEQRAERRRGDAFAEGGDHAAGDEDVPRHGRSTLTGGATNSVDRSAALHRRHEATGGGAGSP